MTAMGHTREDSTTDKHAALRWNASIGPQGEALIIELRAAKKAIDRSQHKTRRDQASPGQANHASPERTLQFLQSTERLDRFDLRSLQNPTHVTEFGGRVTPESDTPPKWTLPSPIRVCLQILRSQLTWLLTGVPANKDPSADFTEQVVRRHEVELKAASRVLILSAAVAGSWATLVPLSGATVLPGTLVVESSVKKIQHPTGGVVAEIPIRDGMHVNAGTLLVRLDEIQLRANQQMLANQLDQFNARMARLVAERDGSSGIQALGQFANRLGDQTIAQLVASETALFAARASVRQAQKDLYENNIRQFEEQIDGLGAEIKAKSSQLELIATELTGVQELYAKGLVPLTRVTTLRRDSARLEGERAQLTASIAETKVKIGQARLQIMKVDQDFRSEVMKELGESRDKAAELMEKLVAAKDQLDRVDIRAPASGVIQQLAIHTIGGVIRPADVIVEIVPDSDDLEIEGHLPPNSIDQVKRGQQAYLRFTAFDRQTTPQLAGALSYVSPDLTHDELAHTSFYTVRIDVPEEERRRLKGLTLVSGMPVEVFLQTGSRTMLSYLLKPITDQFRRMFNEP
jgi:HlyD family secretion protein